MSEKRILDETTASVAASDDYLYIDGATNGSRKITPENIVLNSTTAQLLAQHIEDAADDLESVQGDISDLQGDVADVKSDLGDLTDLDTTDKSSIVNAINELVEDGSGLSNLQKTLIITLFQNAIYTSDQTSNISALYNSFIDHTVEVTGISLNESAITITEAYTLVATLSPSGATGLVEWSSSNTSVATVSQTGLVTPVSDGTTTITASCESYSATCAVTVDTASSVDITQNGTTLVILATPDVSQSGTTLVFS